jgi:hypothetical protein
MARKSVAALSIALAPGPIARTRLATLSRRTVFFKPQLTPQHGNQRMGMNRECARHCIGRDQHNRKTIPCATAGEHAEHDGANQIRHAEQVSRDIPPGTHTAFDRDARSMATSGPSRGGPRRRALRPIATYAARPAHVVGTGQADWVRETRRATSVGMARIPAQQNRQGCPEG